MSRVSSSQATTQRENTQRRAGQASSGQKGSRSGAGPAPRPQGGAAWSLRAPGEGLRPVGPLAGGAGIAGKAQSWATLGRKGPGWGNLRAAPMGGVAKSSSKERGSCQPLQPRTGQAVPWGSFWSKGFTLGGEDERFPGKQWFLIPKELLIC